MDAYYTTLANGEDGIAGDRLELKRQRWKEVVQPPTYVVRKYCVHLEEQWSWKSMQSGRQSYKASTLVNYDSRVVSISNLLVITTLES